MHLNVSSAKWLPFFLGFNVLLSDIVLHSIQYETYMSDTAGSCLVLAGDIGGFLGLLLGGTVITVLEMLDFIIYNCCVKCSEKKRDDCPKDLNDDSTHTYNNSSLPLSMEDDWYPKELIRGGGY